MNVIRNERILQPPRKRCGVKQRELNVPLTKYHLSEFDIEKRRRTNWKPASSSYLKSSRLQSLGRSTKRTRPPISSSLVTSMSRNYASRTETRARTGGGASSLLETTGGAVVLAVTTGRGDARSEVGIAALDIRCPHLILCQISDSQMYASTLSKLYLFDPIEVLMPDTICERVPGKGALYRTIMEKFPELEVTSISRVHFNDTVGLERVKSLCIAEYSSVELFVKQKYYALAAAAALLKYVEYAQRVVYSPKSIKIEFQGSPNATTIDLESARSLELVQSQCGQRNVSLLGILDRCSTPMGRKLLRANILQPPCEERVILERQAAVAELTSNSLLRALLQPTVRRLYGADRLLTLSTTPVFHENSVQCAEHNLNYVLLLKNLLDVVPELERILLAAESDLLRKIKKKLENREFRSILNRILEKIHSDARSVTGYTSSNMQRCFAIKAGINDLLDIARRTYCELIDDMKTMVENLASKYKLTLSLNCNASLGYHCQAILPRNSNAETFDLPSEFIEVRQSRRMYTMTTNALATLSQQCKIACEELHLMSNVLLCDLLKSIREYVGCLFQLSTDVAELDLIVSLAQVSSLQTYVRPTFGSKLELHDSRHPVMEVFGLDAPIPNNVNASISRNLCIISGPNMSGKSTYLKQIVLLHIMAQIGCSVPAKKATFRITDLIFCKIAVRDDIECNASTFALEMKEAQYILRSVTPTSLIVLDELCKGTAIEEGASIAWAICEQLLYTTAFVFAATHFSYLTKLADLYNNVINRHFETISVQETEIENSSNRLTYTHRLKLGVTPTDDYGIVLAELSGLPKSVVQKARKYASEQVVTADRVATNKSRTTRKKTCYDDTLMELYENLQADTFNREHVTLLVEDFVRLWKQMNDAGNTEEENGGGGGEGEGEKEEKEEQRKGEGEGEGEGEREERKTEDVILAVSNCSIGTDTLTKTFQTQTENHNFLNNSFQLPDEHNEHNTNCNHTFHSMDSLSFHSPATTSISNKSARLSIINKTVASPLFRHASSLMRISTKDKSVLKLHEYCLSDEDFEPSDIVSPTSNFTGNILCSDTER